MFWRGRCFGVVNVLARSMFWRCQWFGTFNVLAQSMFWQGQYFKMVDVLAQLYKCRRATIPEGIYIFWIIYRCHPVQLHISSLSKATLLKGNSVGPSHPESYVEVNGIETRSLQTADQCSTTDLRRLSNCLMLAAEQIIYQKYSLCHEFLSDFQKLAIELFTV